VHWRSVLHTGKERSRFKQLTVPNLSGCIDEPPWLVTLAVVRRTKLGALDWVPIL